MPRRLRLPTNAVPGGAAADIAFTGRSRMLAVARRDGSVDLVDAADPDRPDAVRRVAPPLVTAGTSATLFPALGPHGDLLAVARPDGTLDGAEVTVTDLHDPSRSVRLPGPFRAAPPVPEPTGSGVAVAFASGSVVVVTSGTRLPNGPGSLTLWDVADVASPRLLGPPVWSAALLSTSRDGSMAVRFGSPQRGYEVVDLTGAAGPALVGPPVPDGAGPAAGLSADGRTLAVAGGGVWDLSDPAAPRELPKPLATSTNGAGVFVFSPDGRTLATSGLPRDQVGNGSTWWPASSSGLEVWDLSDRDRPRPLAPAVLAGSSADVAFSDDGTTLAAIDDDGAIVAWDLSELLALRDEPREAACAIAARGLDPTEWARYIGTESYVDTCSV